MKVLWLTNIPLPNISEELQLSKSSKGGWMVGLYKEVIEEDSIDLTIAFPQQINDEIICGKVDNVMYFGFYSVQKIWKYDNNVETQLEDILDKVKPDIVHIFGTEFAHALSMTKAFNKPNKTVISIQGLVSVYYDHYYASLPNKITNRYTIRDLIRLDNLKLAREKFLYRGKFEIEALKNVKHVIGLIGIKHV